MAHRQPAKPDAKRPAPPANKEFRSNSEDGCVDQSSEDSFPASDPPSYTPVTHSGKPSDRPVKPKHRQ